MIKFREKKYGAIFDNISGGDIYAKDGVTSGIRGSGTVGKLTRGIAAPLSVGGMVADQGRSAVIDSLNNAKDTASNYTSTIKNAYIPQKTYSVIQAGKEVITGAGKGLLNYGKKNKNALIGAASIGSALTAGSYATNRLQRQKRDVDLGDRKEGLSTEGKVGTAAATIGTGVGLAYKTGKSHDANVSLAQRVSTAPPREAQTFKLSNGTEYTTKTGGTDLSQFKGKEYKKVSDKYVRNSVKDKSGRVLNTAERAKDDLTKMERKRLGGAVSNKHFKMGRNALIGAGIVAGAGLLANSYLKKSKQQSQYSSLEEKSYGIASTFNTATRVGKSVYNKTIQSAGANAGIMDKAKAAGKAVGAGVSVQGKKLARGVGNFFSPGNGKGMINDVRKGLEDTGEYGKKAADFIGRHKTGSMLIGGTVIGSGAFSLANSAGEKPVEALTKLDKKTTDFTKEKEASQYNYSIGETAATLAKNAKRQATENPIAAASFTLMGVNSGLNIYNSKQAKNSKERLVNSLSSISPKKTNIIIS